MALPTPEADALVDVLLAGVPPNEWSISAPETPQMLRDYLVYLSKQPEFQLF